MPLLLIETQSRAWPVMVFDSIVVAFVMVPYVQLSMLLVLLLWLSWLLLLMGLRYQDDIELWLGSQGDVVLPCHYY